MTSGGNVVIYRDVLLPYSETFVRDQAEGLERFTPYYVGSRRVAGLPIPAERTLVLNGGGAFGKAREVAYKLGGSTFGASALYRRVERLNPVLVHAHFGPDGVSALRLARALRVPLLVTFHGFDATIKDEHARRSFYRHRVYLRRRAELQREGRLFLAVSGFLQERLLEQGFPPERTVVHYNGVDTEVFRPDPAVRREPVVLFVGRLVEKKGCEYLIRAMSLVQARRPDVELVVIGTGPLAASLKGLARDLLRRYHFLGAQPPESVRAWMGRAMILSVPSVAARSGDAEGFGLVFAEAQATSLPVVSFATGPIPEVVVHGETGLLAPERDWKTLGAYITLLVEDEALRQRMGEKGEERVRAMFDLRKRTRALEEIYAALAEEGAAATDGR